MRKSPNGFANSERFRQIGKSFKNSSPSPADAPLVLRTSRIYLPVTMNASWPGNRMIGSRSMSTETTALSRKANQFIRSIRIQFTAKSSPLSGAFRYTLELTLDELPQQLLVNGQQWVRGGFIRRWLRKIWGRSNSADCWPK